MNLPSSFAAAFSLGLVGCGGNLTASDAPSQANPLDSEESLAVLQINMVRAAATPPVAAVTVCASLDVSASGHSDDLRDNPSLPVGETGSDGSDVRTRACAAGYTPACSGTPAMAEVVAEGNETGDATVQQWATDPTAGPILVNAEFVVIGVGRSEGVNGYYWTADFASSNDPSCAM